MKQLTTHLFQEGEYNYPDAGNFRPTLTAYLHEDDRQRPAMLIVPGGGYASVAPPEPAAVLKPYFDAGYQVYILTYTTYTSCTATPVELQPLKDISRAICEIRDRSEADNVDINRVYAIGFSAGGHLVASIAVHHSLNGIKVLRDMQKNNRPDAVVLVYPVISAVDFAHKGSFVSLFGQNPEAEKLNLMSLEKHINANTSPAFLVHTMGDTGVSARNSIAFAEGCQSAGVPCELHVFPYGEHGFLAASKKWADGDLTEFGFTLAQLTDNYRDIIEHQPHHLQHTKEELVLMTEEELKATVTNDVILSVCNGVKGMMDNDDYRNNKDYYATVTENWIKMSMEFITRLTKS